MHAPRVAVVLGTFNRKALLVKAVESVRACAGLPATIIAVDGGSTDGSREWLAEQSDVIIIGQRGPLTGAVRAFNLGFGYAVEEEFDFVFHYNDDAELKTPNCFGKALNIMATDASIGEVAFAFDLRGSYGFDRIHDRPYANFGLMRTEAAVAVAKAQGDQSGRRFWNPAYHTYGADTEFGCWLYVLDWKIALGADLHVHDFNKKDAMRSQNESAGRADSSLFWKRWPSPENLKSGPVAP